MNLAFAIATVIAAAFAIGILVFTRVFTAQFKDTSAAIVQALSDRELSHRREAELREMILQLHGQLLEMAHPAPPSTVQTGGIVPPGYRIATPAEQAALRRPARPPNADADDAEDFNFYPGGGSDIPRPETSASKVRSIRDIPVPFGASAFEELARKTKARMAEQEEIPNAAAAAGTADPNGD